MWYIVPFYYLPNDLIPESTDHIKRIQDVYQAPATTVEKIVNVDKSVVWNYSSGVWNERLAIYTFKPSRPVWRPGNHSWLASAVD